MTAKTAFCGAILLGLAASGCATPRPALHGWQDALTQYVMVQGRGDPNVLRDTTDLHSRRDLRPGRITFGRLDLRRDPASLGGKCDVQGVLVAQHTHLARSWYVFVVGVITREPRSSAGLADLRLVAFTCDSGAIHWLTGASDPAALAQYFAGRADDAAEPRGALGPLTFPGPLDVYRLDAAGPSLSVIEERSGATWRLTLAEPVEPTDVPQAAQDPIGG
ncbi:MAG TPA: hypothetical protein PKK06_10680 [Phycisphaerae bacterium]|nr:hypothetical protein [Phycisphaerae bacterium]HNU44967.1 hypothetical protein [Phycisphaerae bacterium]